MTIVPLRRRVLAALAVFALLAPATPLHAGPVGDSLAAALRWRMIGPFRGGRTVAAAGIAGRSHTWYVGAANGGVWRTLDAGRTWTPIFDTQGTASIGAIAIAASEPRIIYVGTGEGLQRPDLSTGDGVYRSDDGGATWRHLPGLRDAQQIADLAVDPRDAHVVYAAVLGHPYGPNTERGLYRSADAGETWQRILGGGDVGAVQVALDAAEPQVVFAVLWSARQPPWEVDDSWTLSEKNGLYKSENSGISFERMGEGLPTAADGLGRIGFSEAQSVEGRAYAIVSARNGGGLYRSDDDAEHWTLVNPDPRLWQRDGDFDEIKVDPNDADLVYVANVATWRSTDGGKSFDAWRGAPGGDDYHHILLSRDDPKVALLAGDQGAIVTLDRGETWSSWYNQPTSQFFHVATDNAFPYRVYGGQQESGSIGIASRGDFGGITARDWRPVGVEEYGAVAPDPLDPNIVYGGKVSRFDWRTGDVQDVSPDPIRLGDWRWIRTMPLVFSQADPHALYLGANVVFVTRDGGQHWRTISPDLTRPAPEVPATLGAFAAVDPEHGKHRGVVYALAPSPLAPHLLWAGTDDGRIHVTHDEGGAWRDVTPPALTAWSKVSMLEASHFDTLEAWAAINRFRLDDLRPHVWRTRDGGRHWTEVVLGIAPTEVVNAVREDPQVKGLLYAATERGVWFSLDDGGHWTSLRLNLPATSVRDLVVHGSDLAIGTHGRSFWILDDVTPLRQAAAAAAAKTSFLFQPERAVRVRWNRNTDTPPPPDEPAGENPPDGAIVDYWLPAAAGNVTLEFVGADGAVARRYASTDAPDTARTEGDIPGYWVKPNPVLPGTAGVHRFVWDLRGEPPTRERRRLSMAAVAHATPREPRGPWALPGRYTVRLTVDGVAQERALDVTMDPRCPASAADLAAQHALSVTLADGIAARGAALARLRAARAALGGAVPADTAAVDAAAAAARAADALLGAAAGGPAAPGELDPSRLPWSLAHLYDDVVRSDAAPTPAMTAAAEKLLAATAAFVARVDAATARLGAATRH